MSALNWGCIVWCRIRTAGLALTLVRTADPFLVAATPTSAAAARGAVVTPPSHCPAAPAAPSAGNGVGGAPIPLAFSFPVGRLPRFGVLPGPHPAVAAHGRQRRRGGGGGGRRPRGRG